jgi:hypothetical protein
MRNRRFILAALFVAIATVVVLGGLSASSMGFKVVLHLDAAGPNSLSGFNTLSLPFVRKPGIDTVSDLFQDIGWENVAAIQRHLPASQSFQTYSLGSPDFPLVAGEGLFVQMINDYDYRVVGSHDPSIGIELQAGGPENLTGDNFVALPYHSPAVSASELFQEIGYENIAIIQEYVPANGNFVSYSLISSDFAIERGEAVFLQMIRHYTWYPTHY